MASLVAKKKGNKLYYYVVETARVQGKPRIVHQAYLGTADKVRGVGGNSPGPTLRSAPPPPQYFCWPPSTASASPTPKPTPPTGIAPPTPPRVGSFPPN